ncbi:MAG: ABC transporter permease subunit [Candidatus Nealsonbacteria bacterium]|nr:ABC transporter permease subunit [Candidatus Nealsonbacteria bacterium]
MNYLKVIYQNLIREYLILIRRPAGLVFALFLPTLILVVIATSFPGEFLDVKHARIPIIRTEENEALVDDLAERISSDEFGVVIKDGDENILKNLVKDKEYLMGIYPEIVGRTQKINVVVDNSNPLARDAILVKLKSKLEKEDSSIVKKEVYKNDLRFIDYLFPGIISLGTMFFCLSLASIGVVRERVSGTLERIRSSPLPLWIFLISKYIAYIILAAIAGIFILLSGYYLFDIPIAGPIVLVILMEILTATPFIGLALITSTIGKSEFESQVIVLFISIPAIFISGIFFPLQCMPRYIAEIVKFFPLAYSTEALRDVIIRGFGFSQIIPAFKALVIYSLGFFVLAVLFFRRREK